MCGDRSLSVAPFYGSRSGEPEGSGSVGIELVEIPHSFDSMLLVLDRLPSGCVVPLPLYEVLQPVVEEPAVLDSFHFSLLFPVNDDRQGRWGSLARERVIRDMLKQRHVEHRVQPRSPRQSEAYGVRHRALDNLIQAQMAVVKLP